MESLKHQRIFPSKYPQSESLGKGVGVEPKNYESFKKNAFRVIILLIVVVGYYFVQLKKKMLINFYILNGAVEYSQMVPRVIRDYIISGDKQYYDLYWELVKASAGNEDWGNLSTNPWFKGKKMSLRGLYEFANIHPDDRKYLLDSLDITTQLIWDEIQVINWNDGFFDTDGKAKKEFDKMGNEKKFIRFEDKQKPDPQKAIDYLYTKEYLDRLEQVQNLVQQGFYKSQTREINLLTSLKGLYFALILVAMVLLFYVNDNQIGYYKIVYAILLTTQVATSIYVFKQFEKSLIEVAIGRLAWNTSERLTQNIRNYAVTGKTEDIDNFWKIVNLRWGKADWAEFYNYNFFKGNRLTMDQLYTNFLQNSESVDFFKKAIQESNTLVWREIQAINWVDGFYDEDGSARKKFEKMDAEGSITFIRFGKKGEPDHQKAIDNLYTIEYLNDKKKIYALSQQGMAIVYEDAAKRNTRTKNIMYLLFILDILALVADIGLDFVLL